MLDSYEARQNISFLGKSVLSDAIASSIIHSAHVRNVKGNHLFESVVVVFPNHRDQLLKARS